MGRILAAAIANSEYRPGVVGVTGSSRGLFPRFLVVFLVAVAVFAPAVTYGFAYDDSWTIQWNHALDAGLVPLARQLLLGQAMAAHTPDATRPWMVLSMWLDRRLFGDDPSGYHLHSLLLYGAAATTSALCTFALTRRRAAALFGGVFFAVAPVHAEVAVAINYREDLHAGIAVMGILAALFWPRKRPASARESIALAALLAVGLLGKESAVTWVLLAPVLAAARGDLGPWARRHGRLLAALGTTSLVWGLWRVWLRLSGRDDVPLVRQSRGLVERVLRTARYVCQTAADGLFPVRWAPDHSPSDPASPLWLLGVAALLGAAWWLARRRERALLRGLALAALAGLSTSPLLSPINERADRYAFLSVLGGSVVWGTLFARLPAAPRLLRRAALWGSALALALIARGAAAPWQSDLTLWTAGTARAPRSARAFAGLSRALRLKGDLDGADAAVAHAVELDPTFLRARVTVVYNALARGDMEKATRAIAQVDAMGGSTQLGMKRARRCAGMSREEAIRCSGFSPQSGENHTPVDNVP